MKTTYLFPYRYKFVSGIVFLASFILFVLFYYFNEYADFNIKAKVFAIVGNSGFEGKNKWFDWVQTSITDEILFAFLIISGLVYAFSKEKTEDEMVASIRLNSLVKATIGNYLILLFLYLTVYGFSFLMVLDVAMFSQLLIFIVLFRISMYRFNKSGRNEE
ncbi:MAG: hypothetical protein ACLGH8_07850 [Bacteroidia bacterium]